MNPLIAAYLPDPERFPYAKAFFQNITTWKHDAGLFLFSDHREKYESKEIHECDNPDRFAKPNELWRVHNYVFIQAIKRCIVEGASHLIYFESDSRVQGHEWDKRIMLEFAAKTGALAGGTPTVWNFNRSGTDLTMRTIAYANQYQAQMLIPMSFHGEHGHLRGNGLEGKHPFCLYPQGGVTVYDVGFLKTVVPTIDTEEEPLNDGWDMEIGFRLIMDHGTNVFRKCVWLESVFSGWQDDVMDLNQRKAALLSGRFCAIHQVKDEDPMLP